jgi:hypothetical protein
VTSLGFDDEGGAAFGVRGDTVPHTYRGERLTVAFIGDLTNLNYLAIKGGVRGDKVRTNAEGAPPSKMLRRTPFLTRALRRHDRIQRMS